MNSATAPAIDEVLHQQSSRWPSVSAWTVPQVGMLLRDADSLRLGVTREKSTIIDAGINVTGGLEAGRRIAEIKHQRAAGREVAVLATGDLRDAGGGWVIEIYDPNHPGRFTYLQVARRVQSWDPGGESLVSDRRWRGLFALPYAYERPYWLRAG